MAKDGSHLKQPKIDRALQDKIGRELRAMSRGTPQTAAT